VRFPETPLASRACLRRLSPPSQTRTAVACRSSARPPLHPALPAAAAAAAVMQTSRVAAAVTQLLMYGSIICTGDQRQQQTGM